MGNRWDQAWRIPPAFPSLDDEDVHVWGVSLSATPRRVDALLGTLAPDERMRAERFRLPRDRARFIIGRGLLRGIIARYLDREPGAITFRHNAFGKPSLPDAPGWGGLRFNVSHADGIALYALARDRAVGVDIERIRADIVGERVAERFFSRREVAALRALNEDRQPEAFACCWTRKEAYKKARGEGIAVGLDRFDVSLAPGEPAAILANRDEDAGGRRWSLQHLTPHTGYVGAVAIEGEPGRLTLWRWQEPDDRACGWGGEGVAPRGHGKEGEYGGFVRKVGRKNDCSVRPYG